MKKTKILALLLAVLMLVLCFAGCGKSADYGTVNGKKIDADLYNAMVRSTFSSFLAYGYTAENLASMLEQQYDESGATVGDMYKETFLENIKQYQAVEQLAKEHDIALTAEDKAYLDESKAASIEEAGGKAEFVASLKEQGLTEEIYDYVQENGCLMEKVFTALYGPGGVYEVNQADIVSDVVANNVRVRHVVIVGSESDEDFADKQAKAAEVLRRAKAGEDFEALIAEYGEDPGMTSLPEGYVFNKNGLLADGSSTLDPTFTETSFAIGVNEISDVILSTSGLHVIKRLPLDEAYVTENIDTYYSSYASTAFQNKLIEIAETYEVKTTEAFDNLDLLTLID